MTGAEFGLGLAVDLSWRWALQAALVSAVVAALLWCAGHRPDSGLARTSTIVMALLPLGLLWQPGWPVALGSAADPASLCLAAALLQPVPVALAGLWLAGAAIGVLLLGLQVYRQRVALSAAAPCADAALRRELELVLAARPTARRIVRRLRLRLGARCCASSIGVPIIALPAAFQSWPSPARRAVLAHEIEHLQARDDRWLLGFDLIARLLWFCPWLLGARRHALQALEAAADERAASRLGDRGAYLEGLATAALLERESPAAGGLLAATRSSLLGRLDRLLQGERRAPSSLPMLAVGCAGAVVLLTGYHAAESAAVVWPADARQAPAVVESDRPFEDYALPSVTSLGPRPVGRREPLPVYPGAALQAGVGGVVTVEFGVAGDGSVVAPRVVASKPPKLFDDAAIEAVRQARFARSSESSAERVVLRKSYRFSLEPAAARPIDLPGLRRCTECAPYPASANHAH
ncbi:MAG: TonB family protein [Pseudomonadota bacterium]